MGEKTTIGGVELLGVQILGCIVIILWAGGLSAIFFLISMKMNALRLSEQNEILGGDLHYFGPIEFDGNPSDYDLAEICGKMIFESAKKISQVESQVEKVEEVEMQGELLKDEETIKNE